MMIVNEHDDVPGPSYILRSCNARTTSNEPYTLSAWMKTDAEAVPVKLGDSLVTVTRDWRRYSVPFVNQGRSLYDDMVNIIPQAKGTLWIDAVQLEAGTDATDYRPADKERRLLAHDGNPEKQLFDVPRTTLPVKKSTIVYIFDIGARINSTSAGMGRIWCNNQS